MNFILGFALGFLVGWLLLSRPEFVSRLFSWVRGKLGL
jgi:hypothetical protein